MSEQHEEPEAPADPPRREGDPGEKMSWEGAPVEPNGQATQESGADETHENAGDANSETEQPSALDRELEIFQDLQRLQADFVNYRARVERDRGVERQAAVAETIRAFLPALDDLARAEEHGDLVEGSPMAAVATKLRAAGEKFGLKPFGAKGEKFDPELHDALVQTPNPDVTEATVADVIETGYQLGDRQLRPAKVAVFVPAETGSEG
jgi:molecular chaperone GrpE